MKKTKFLGIDIGGTTVKAGILEISGDKKPDFLKLGEVKFRKNPDELLSNLSNLVGRHLLNKISGAGIAVAGDTDTERGIVRFSPNFGWKNIPLKKIARRQLGLSLITVENDANAAAYGAYIFECGGGKYPDMVCLTLGTGVGGGIIIDGKLYRGATSSAGEFGHINYKEDGVLCSCGSKGCFERYLGRDAITERAIRIIRNYPAQKKRYSPDNLTPKIISEAAGRKEKWALLTWEETGRILGILLSDIVNIFNPHAIVLAGGVSSGAGFFIKHARREMLRRTFKTSGYTVKIVVSRKPDILGAAGAAALSARLF